MAKIFKYPLSIGINKIEVPEGSIPLSVQEQGRDIVLWVLHPNINAPKVKMILNLVATGQEFINDGNYLETFQCYAGLELFVFHVFYKIS